MVTKVRKKSGNPSPHEPEIEEEVIEDIDPETGEIIAPAQSFAHFLATLEEGVFNGELSEEMASLVQELRDASRVSGGKEKGSISFKVEFTIDQELMLVKAGNLRVSRPAARRTRTVFYHNREGTLQRENPRQQKLPLHVATKGPVRA